MSAFTWKCKYSQIPKRRLGFNRCLYLRQWTVQRNWCRRSTLCMLRALGLHSYNSGNDSGIWLGHNNNTNISASLIRQQSPGNRSTARPHYVADPMLDRSSSQTLVTVHPYSCRDRDVCVGYWSPLRFARVVALHYTKETEDLVCFRQRKQFSKWSIGVIVDIQALSAGAGCLGISEAWRSRSGRGECKWDALLTFMSLLN